MNSKILIPAFVTLLGATAAYGESAELSLFLPTDTAGNQLFSLNPAAFLPKGGAAGYADVFHSTKITHQRTSDNDNQKFTSESESETRALGFVNRVGTGVGLGLFATYERERLDSKSEFSNMYNDAPADEYFTKKTVSGMFNIEFAQGMRVGINYRQIFILNKVIGSFGVQRGDAETVKGSLSGMTIGGFLGSGAMGFGLFYRLAPRGKVHVAGEDKISSEPGIISASMHYDFTKEFRFGLSIFKWMNEKDELAAETTNGRDQTFFMRGLSRESTLFPTESAAVGGDYTFTSNVVGRFGISYEQNQFSADATKISTQEKRAANSMRARLGLQFSNAAVTILAGGDYAPRKYSATENQTKVTHSATDLNGFGSIAFNF